jgi:hypothetical protein
MKSYKKTVLKYTLSVRMKQNNPTIIFCVARSRRGILFGDICV